MGKFIRGNQLDKYNRYEEEIARPNKKRKIKKFRDTEEQIARPNKKRKIKKFRDTEEQKNKLIKRD